ncbi:MAG: glycoside hydrolase family 48 protein [Candidatus Margulisbacteria bacterium]|nr:glycoside hydrolase family 48 protein [Candidatus Margulisiibacteriota bacterium]
MATRKHLTKRTTISPARIKKKIILTPSTIVLKDGIKLRAHNITEKKKKKRAGLIIFLLILLAIALFIAWEPNINFRKAHNELYKDIYDPKNGYFAKNLLPYHSVEPFIVEAVDHGHVSTSEGISSILWMNTIHAGLTGDWKDFHKTWAIIEDQYIPTKKEQPNLERYNWGYPAAFVPFFDDIHKYPARIDYSKKPGIDPLYTELTKKYGRYPYLMHWMLDPDNWFGFAKKGTTKAVKIKLFERGRNESIWKSIPHPSYDIHGRGLYGYNDTYVTDSQPQWRYISAPDAEMRVVQSMYWASIFAKNQKIDIKPYIERTKKMGDFIRYALFDKYFHEIGEGWKRGKGANSAHYLVSWVAGWGGGIGYGYNRKWSWRIGYNEAHSGYQNPLAAYYLDRLGVNTWRKSLERQLELISWVQSKEGVVGGGVINDYDKPRGFFYGMRYNQAPMYNDPPSNVWAGWQFFLMERVAEYYYESGDRTAYAILSRWIPWAKNNLKMSFFNRDVLVPSTLEWSGSPETLNLSAKVVGYNSDVACVSLLAMTFMFWDEGNQKWIHQKTHTTMLAKKMLTRMWKKYYDGVGIAPLEYRPDYSQAWTNSVLPKGLVKKLANGSYVTPSSNFLDFRPGFSAKDIPPKGPYTKENPIPKYHYHRTWAQAHFDIALGYVIYFDKLKNRKVFSLI